MLRATTIFTILTALLCSAATVQADKKKTDKKVKTAAKAEKDGWIPLFNGKNIDGWKVTNFGGEGEVKVEDGCVVITQGVDLSGVTTTRKDLASFRTNYELEFQTQRSLGNDFFVGVTFPYKDSHISLICGGWGGSLCGLSSLSGLDASENETMSVQSFTNGQWYDVRIRVTDRKIEAWMRESADKDRKWTDEENLVDVETADHKIDVRFEVDLSKPLGFATYQSTAKIRNARIRHLPKAKKSGPEKTTK